MEKKFYKTSLLHRNIGKHEHEMMIFNSYETYAVCKKCGLHDWSMPDESLNVGNYTISNVVEHFKNKYPKHEIVNDEL